MLYWIGIIVYVKCFSSQLTKTPTPNSVFRLQALTDNVTIKHACGGITRHVGDNWVSLFPKQDVERSLNDASNSNR